MIPATGWYAIFREDDGTILKTPLVCWALIEDSYRGQPQITYVAGMDVDRGQEASVENCAESTNFVSLVHENDPSAWLDRSIAEFAKGHPLKTEGDIAEGEGSQ